MVSRACYRVLLVNDYRMSRSAAALLYRREWRTVLQGINKDKVGLRGDAAARGLRRRAALFPREVPTTQSDRRLNDAEPAGE